MNRREKSKRNSAQLQRSLVASLQKNDIENFERVLIDDADVHYSYIKSPVFELACKTPGKSAFIEIFIVHGVQLNKMNPVTGKYPIHLAAESHDASNLVVLLNQPTLLMDQETREGKTALCILCDTTRPDNWDNVYECIKLLINCHANINKPSIDGKTPLQMLMDNSTDKFKMDILSFCSMNCFLNVSQETRATIQDKYNVEISEYTAQHKHFDELRDVLNKVEDEQILEGFQVKNPNTAEFSEVMIRKLLEMCIYRCKPQAANQIINSRLDNGKLKNPSKLLGRLLAKCCMLGACEMLQLFLDIIPEGRSGSDFLNQDPLLLYVVENMDSKVHKNSCDFFECMEILLRDPRIEIDKRDGLNRTALQMAGRCKNNHAQKLLLAKGAYIGGSDIDGNHTIGEINLEVLKKHFDSCIRVSDSPQKRIQQFEVDVTNLVVPKFKSDYKEHTYQHSTDTTFHNVLLLLLDLMKFDSMEPNQIILHPLISCWLHLKWLHCRPVWWVEFGFCTMFLVCFHGYVKLWYYAENSKTEWYTTVLAVLAFMVGLPYMFLVINQLCLKRIQGTRYIAGWLKLFLLALAASFLGTGFVHEKTQRVIAAITFVWSGFVFLVTIDTVSCLSLSTHIFMLQVVFLNLLKCLIPCVIIVCTFAMSFHMLLQNKDVTQTFKTSDVGNTTESVISISDEFNAFKYIGLALPKTVVMMIGEFDASSMALKYIPFAIMFLLFVLCVSIAFVNLMNGLAVSDVAELRKKSKLFGIGQKIKMLYQYQHTLNRFNWILCKIGCPRWRQNEAYVVPDTMHRIIIKLHKKRVVDICLLRKPSEPKPEDHADQNDVELIGQESMYGAQKDKTQKEKRYRMDKKIVGALKQNYDFSKIYRAHCASCYKF